MEDAGVHVSCNSTCALRMRQYCRSTSLYSRSLGGWVCTVHALQSLSMHVYMHEAPRSTVAHPVCLSS